MSSPPPVENFKGTNWEECHKFILAIRTRALWEGKSRDSPWVADFAATYFWHKALVWHCQLPEDVRQDWSKLQAALVDRWPPPEDEELQIQPTPAAVPSLTPNDKVNSPLEGILKVVVDGSNRTYYVKPPAEMPYICHLSSNRDEALRVRCNPLCGTTLLERTDHTCHSWLVVGWQLGTPKAGARSTAYARITQFDSDTLKSAWGDDSSLQLQLLRCTVLPNGEIIPVWKEDDTTEITLLASIVSDSYLFLVTDPEACMREFGATEIARFFIEPFN